MQKSVGWMKQYRYWKRRSKSVNNCLVLTTVRRYSAWPIWQRVTSMPTGGKMQVAWHHSGGPAQDMRRRPELADAANQKIGGHRSLQSRSCKRSRSTVGENCRRTAANARRQPPRVLLTEHCLGVAYTEAGQLEQAMKLLAKTVQGQQQTLGHENPDTLDSMISVGSLYVRQGEYAEAEPLLTEAHKGCLKRQAADRTPRDDQQLHDVLTQLVELYEKSNQQEKADEYRKKLKEHEAAPETGGITETIAAWHGWQSVTSTRLPVTSEGAGTPDSVTPKQKPKNGRRVPLRCKQNTHRPHITRALIVRARSDFYCSRGGQQHHTQTHSRSVGLNQPSP